MLTTEYQLWAERTGEAAVLQRRQWERFYVLQALHQEDALEPGAKGLVIGTDRDPIEPFTSGRGCDLTTVAPGELEGVGGHGFDFAWSISALDELGDLDARLQFVRRSLDVLRPGAVAVHTTSLAVAPRRPALRLATRGRSTPAAMRQRDLVELERLLRADGHSIDCTFVLGDLPADRWVDRPPYSPTHLCAATAAGTVTSFGILVRKAAR
jgi:hypothetical protein